ncbi:response regulator transcription factor [Ghiorsea bivora]|uniref:response regulator transcription factor n=1 Tax=Ghiorsea bivora TaxID=1485545 RepID=UPI00056E050D|nr:response regulator transcription factor [Ghiorsea bivora]
MNKQILIVEDNADLASLIALHVQDMGCTSDIAGDGGKALRLYEQNDYDLVLLDIMLPVMDGIEVCKKMREGGKYIPIMMLTSKTSEIDRVVGLEVGADDYISKPFSIPELLARIKAQFRSVDALIKSQENVKQNNTMQVGDMSIDLAKRQVFIADKEIQLTAKEFDLLVYFAKHPGQVFTRSQLLDHVWGYQFEGYDHTVNTHINRLRMKVEQDAANPEYILTVWGVGYKFGDSKR